MNTCITRHINTPIREKLSWSDAWLKEDKGLILCWEIGRKKSKNQPELAEKTKNGELPLLGWKGGIDKKIQKNTKYGSLNYLAQWQGLKGESLTIDKENDTTITCTKTEMTVIFTADISKYSNN